jgi:transcriptional regulator with GAF, ATPase, and Fis domain
LVQFLVAKFGARVGRRIESIEKATMDWLANYRWPGNVRELENVLERAIILSNGPTLEIDPEVFGSEPKQSSLVADQEVDNQSGQAGDSLEAIERNHILSVLKQTKWVVEGPRGAAKILELHPNTLRSRMKKLAIRRASIEQSD